MDFRRKSAHIPFAREGIPYVLMAGFVTGVMAILGHHSLAWLALATTLLIGHFFRDPERVVAAGAADVVAPADGKVIAVERVTESRFTHKTCWKISIFMSVLDVHVNRIPCSATVHAVHYQSGSFFAANRLAASRTNEQNWLWLRTPDGRDVILTQVAGLIARRIVCWPAAGDAVECGERFGMIRFGSRVDLYLPEQSTVLVAPGDRVCAGGSIVCRMS